MSNDPLPSDPADEELETLAQDLLGVSLNEPTDVEPFDVGDFDLDELEPEPSSEPDSITESDDTADAGTQEERSTGQQPVVNPVVDDDFGASLLDDDSEAAAPAAKQMTRPTVAGGEAVTPVDTVSAESDEAEPETEEPASRIDPEDDYWDALDGFNWDEESDTQKTKSQFRKAYVEASDTFEDLSIESAEKTDEFIDDAEFGAGLDDDVSILSAGGAAAGAGEELDDDTESTGQRRRGRRRRGRGRARDAEKRSQPPDSSAAEEGRRSADSEEGRLPDDDDVIEDDLTREADLLDDGFGAGLEIGDTEEDKPKKRRRRRGGRRRGRRKAAADSSSDERSSSESVVDDRQKSVSEQSEPPSKQPAEGKYRSVPTWEEAISYLVRRESKRANGGSKSGSGFRRGGRRGSGRRHD